MGTDEKLDRLLKIHDELRALTEAWGANHDYGADKARSLREEAALINHQRYMQQVPAYRSLADSSGITEELNDVEVIKEELMSTDDIFKSYSPSWIDSSDWKQMTA